MSMPFTLHLLTLTFAFASLASVATSRPQFRSLLPNGFAGSRPDSGINCVFMGHTPCEPGATRNAFGNDFEINGFVWDKTLCEKDSDGDGLTNGEELGDPCCEWSADSPTDLRLTLLSHPGDSDSVGASLAPKCVKSTKTKPEETKPEKNKPEKNKPEDNKPEDNKPEDNKPEDNKPEDNKPEDNKPEDNKPGKTKPTKTPSVDRPSSVVSVVEGPQFVEEFPTVEESTVPEPPSSVEGSPVVGPVLGEDSVLSNNFFPAVEESPVEEAFDAEGSITVEANPIVSFVGPDFMGQEFPSTTDDPLVEETPAPESPGMKQGPSAVLNDPVETPVDELSPTDQGLSDEDTSLEMTPMEEGSPSVPKVPGSKGKGTGSSKGKGTGPSKVKGTGPSKGKGTGASKGKGAGASKGKGSDTSKGKGTGSSKGKGPGPSAPKGPMAEKEPIDEMFPVGEDPTLEGLSDEKSPPGDDSGILIEDTGAEDDSETKDLAVVPSDAPEFNGEVEPSPVGEDLFPSSTMPESIDLTGPLFATKTPSVIAKPPSEGKDPNAAGVIDVDLEFPVESPNDEFPVQTDSPSVLDLPTDEEIHDFTDSDESLSPIPIVGEDDIAVESPHDDEAFALEPSFSGESLAVETPEVEISSSATPAIPGVVGGDPTTVETPFVSLSPVPTDESVTGTPGSEDDDDDDGVCFPAHATVELEDGRSVPMSDVQIGDRVHVGNGQYSDVFMFTHRLSNVRHEFVTLKTGMNGKVERSVSATKGHFLYVGGVLKEAGKVVVGDELTLGNGQGSRVISIECGKSRGLYNPQTVHGDLVVDGVRVSTYTTAVEISVAHSLLAPLRAAYRTFGWSTSMLDAGADRMAALLR